MDCTRYAAPSPMPTFRDCWTQTKVVGRLATIPGVRPSGVVPANMVKIIQGVSCRRVEFPLDKSSLRVDVPPLTDYQKRALNFACGRRDTALWAVVGSGKSRTALTWAACVAKKTLFVTKTAARRTIEAEVAKWTTLKSSVLTSQTPDFERIVRADICIIGYDILPFWVAELEAWLMQNGSAIVFDEVQHVKSWKRERASERSVGNRASAAKRLSVAADRRLVMTGTPIRDRPKDLWAELDLMEPEAWGSSWDFMIRYAGATKNSYGGLDCNGTSHEEELKKRLDEVAFRVGYEEVQRDMPPKVRDVIRIPKEEQLDVEAARGLVKGIDRFGDKIHYRIALATALKRTALLDLIRSEFDENQKRKVVVFTFLRSDAEALGKAIEWMRVPTITTHGGTSAEKREKLRQRFMSEPGPLCLVATAESFGEAVALNDADVAILASLPFTPGQLEQYEGRFHRKGQTKKVRIVLPIAVGTVDEYIANILLNKLPIIGSAVGLGGVEGMKDSLQKSVGLNDEAVVSELMKMISEGEHVD